MLSYLHGAWQDVCLVCSKLVVSSSWPALAFFRPSAAAPVPVPAGGTVWSMEETSVITERGERRSSPPWPSWSCRGGAWEVGKELAAPHREAHRAICLPIRADYRGPLGAGAKVCRWHVMTVTGQRGHGCLIEIGQMTGRDFSRSSVGGDLAQTSLKSLTCIGRSLSGAQRLASVCVVAFPPFPRCKLRGKEKRELHCFDARDWLSKSRRLWGMATVPRNATFDHFLPTPKVNPSLLWSPSTQH